jgi:hypothetical protein
VFADFENIVPNEVHVQVENIQAFYKCNPDGQENAKPWEMLFG